MNKGRITPGLVIGDRYTLERIIGSGAYSEVWYATDYTTGNEVAIKFSLPLKPETISKLTTFLKSLFGLRHENVISLLSVDIYQQLLYYVMPYYNIGSTSKYIDKSKQLTEHDCWMILHDIGAGLLYLFERTSPIIHQNIKPENILISDNGKYVLTDLGGIFQKISNEQHYSIREESFSFVGNNSYAAPELWGKHYAIAASDIWALGAVMYEIMTGETPFGDMGGQLQLNGEEIPKIKGDYSQELKDLVFGLLSVNPWDRPTAKMIEKYAYNKLNGIEADGLPNSLNVNNGCARNEITSGHINKTVSSRKKEGLFHSSIRKIKKLFLSKEQRTYNSFVPSSLNKEGFVESSIFAPAEVKRKSHMLVQVYLHLYEETEMMKTQAQESDRNAERRDYIPLQYKLKKGDKVEVLLNIYGETLLMSDKKSIVWQGTFTKCSFDYFVPKDIDVDELSCVAFLSVNDVPVGEMRFITQIVYVPRQLNPEIVSHKYNKVFISYSHQDESKVKFLHEGLELGAVPHFFDRKYLKAGDVFPQVIQDYINSADLFILCWSENASKSEYVQKERLQALERAFPQVQPEKAAKLRIYPMCIEPRAELPGDMKNYYHFGEM